MTCLHLHFTVDGWVALSGMANVRLASGHPMLIRCPGVRLFLYIQLIFCGIISCDTGLYLVF